MSLRALCGALLALPLLLLAACSYSTDFVVVNDSGSPVEVSYSFKDWREPRDCCPSRPLKKALAKLDDDDVEWTELRAEDFQFDRAVGVVTVTLAPSEVLRVDVQSNWGGHGDRRDDENFRIASLRITGESGSVYYEGLQAQYQFRSEDGRLYKLTYYGWGDKRDDRGR
jgi:hypothetical protein